MSKNKLPPRVFFNASVIIAGLNSPSGGSAKLLKYAKQKQITGIISEIIVDEVLRHWDKLKKSKSEIDKNLKMIFSSINPAPSVPEVEKWQKVVIDAGDAHVLAAAKESNSQFLVTLDQKHLLILQKKIKYFRIVSPKQLIEYLN
ncbi:putative toxin-antitoxin system toxin component, PIN family [Candidatus Gottesmanbacteria bacterium RIFCSPHIGHO2_02_FULL_40_13]|uniref:Putative toxin-antitoxin system toxin component, PIN family n=1 Tax=Candidatus Gottesmanbacteria bacterium RIFCSPHIGHO2_02_FULL_40_13 TaxID=1798384 RepID=A0A1F6A9H0_9BACT|nr:MAG: putative toxin-antitoxin system toxin component, PIN family [Candidatus Gottesmanbacteria bacterium RIFCSPHIGHO2_02_FULL_40_13]